MDIEYDRFVCTTDETHAAIVREVDILSRALYFCQKSRVFPHTKPVYISAKLYAQNERHTAIVREVNILKRGLYFRKRAIYFLKRAMYSRKRAVYFHEEALFSRESRCARLTTRMPPLFVR